MNISELLQKYTAFIPRERIIKDGLVRSLREVLSLEIEPSDIEVRETQVFINTSPLKKHAIGINREAIAEVFKTITKLDLPDLV